MSVSPQFFKLLFSPLINLVILNYPSAKYTSSPCIICIIDFVNVPVDLYSILKLLKKSIFFSKKPKSNAASYY